MTYYNETAQRGGISPSTERRSMIAKEGCREEDNKEFHRELNELRTSIARII